MIEYDAPSLWYDASITIAGNWLRTGGDCAYFAMAQTVEQIRVRLRRLGLDVDSLERHDKLRLFDCYSITLGQKPNEKWSLDSLKVGDVSIQISKWMKDPAFDKPGMGINDDLSTMARFNDEKNWVEFLLTRNIPAGRKLSAGSAGIDAYVNGVHSDWVYKRLEASYDGIVDFKFDESGDEPTTLMRIRRMRNARFDGRWHQLKLAENFEVILEK